MSAIPRLHAKRPLHTQSQMYTIWHQSTEQRTTTLMHQPVQTILYGCRYDRFHHRSRCDARKLCCWRNGLDVDEVVVPDCSFQRAREDTALSPGLTASRAFFAIVSANCKRAISSPYLPAKTNISIHHRRT
jgi:hypothetical protein